jgi:hypothetical protein
MRTHTPAILALVLLEGAAAVWAAWEVWSVRPGRQPKADDPETPPVASKDDPGHLEG